MKSVVLPLAAVAASIAVLSAQQPPPAPSFRGGVDLVSLNVTVTEGTKYVTDLSQAPGHRAGLKRLS